MKPDTKARIRANGNLVSGKPESKYGEMPDGQNRQSEGDVEQTLGRIRKKTASSVEAFENEIEQILL